MISGRLKPIGSRAKKTNKKNDVLFSFKSIFYKDSMKIKI